ncbi:methyltransferase domain-containing protein [Nostoc calcicola FACHB-3891]|nr:methyltransferase domain-containing protein [Nostoc calcicola FACHB-3891]
MEFTGERYIPAIDGQIKYEHLHRYALCLDFVIGKSVLDIASGEGYGSALLARVAESVIGVDISSEAVEYSSQEYRTYDNLKFMLGSCEAVPLPDNCVDVVTSFETIEHHDKHEEMMLEIKRVLKPEGILIISSPNRLTYSDEPNYSNPFHVKELYYNDLVSLLGSHFKYMKIYGQRLATGSFVFPLEDSQEKNLKAYKGNLDNLNQQVCSLKSPIYFVAICSDELSTIQTPIDSIYIDESDDLLQGQTHAQLQQTRAELERSQSRLQQTEAELERSQSRLQQTEAELERSQSRLQQTEAELERSQSQLQQTQAELERSQSQLQQTQAELERTQSQLQQTHTELERTQSQLQQTHAELERTQSQLQQTHAELERTQSQLQQTHVELERSQSRLQQTLTALEQFQVQLQKPDEEYQNKFDYVYQQWQETQRLLQQAQSEWRQTQDMIQAMETSKFWKLRQIWFQFKRTIGLKVD